MILIGVSSCFFYPDPARIVFGHKTLQYLERDMARYLSRADVLPVLIPDLLEASQLKNIFSKLGGLVLQGGSDLCPQTYGATPLDSTRWPGDPYRDEYEIKLMDLAKDKGLPVLGICRGAQLINVYFGGTLYQDLATEFDKTVLHRDAHLYDHVSHEVSLEKGGQLQKIYPQSKIVTVNSVHHQGIKTLGQDLKIEARSVKDGLIEAISYAGPQNFYCLGVQWHPEFSATLGEGVLNPEPLYDDFLNVVRST